MHVKEKRNLAREYFWAKALNFKICVYVIFLICIWNSKLTLQIAPALRFYHLSCQPTQDAFINTYLTVAFILRSFKICSYFKVEKFNGHWDFSKMSGGGGFLFIWETFCCRQFTFCALPEIPCLCLLAYLSWV